jgi:hypothetical protein
MLGIPGKKATNVFDDDYTVLDAQKVPPNTMEAM